VRIKEFRIIRYGPLTDTGSIALNNFNLFFGQNEDGKTLTIDALVKFLLKQNIRNFKDINRVEERPEGYLILEVDDNTGKDIKLPETANLTEITDLTPADCLNIFIIRDSDLSITGESQFYTNVTDRLTGLRTKEILKIKEALRKIGKLTRADSNASLSDSEDFNKAKSRLKKAVELIKKISNLEVKIREARFDEFEEELVAKRERINEIKQAIEGFEEARKREKYEKGKEGVDKLREALKELRGLETYNESEEQLWRENENNIKLHNQNKKELISELEKRETELKKTTEKLAEKEQDFQTLSQRKKELDGDVKLKKIPNYEQLKNKIVSGEPRDKFLLWTIAASFVLLVLSIVGYIIRQQPLFFILAALSVATLTTAAFFTISSLKNKASLNRLLEKIKLETAKFGLSAENIEKILANIRDFDDEYSRKVSELEKLRMGKQVLEENLKKLKEERLPGIENKIEKAKKVIEEIREKSATESLQDYSKKLKLKHVNQKLIGEQKSILSSLFGEENVSLEENISFWDREVEAFKLYKNKAKGIKHDEKAVSKLKEEAQLFEEELDEISSKMSSVQNEMREVERDVNQILQVKDKEYLYCRTSVDLKAIKKKLREFAGEIETTKENALEAMRIFESIETSEKEKVSTLFGKDSPISKYFKEITGDLYKEVSFNQETGKIEIRRRDGAILTAEKLSGGAYDQLYLAIRLALGEKLLKGSRGFFIMDDPFIKADCNRLKKLVEMLKKISQLGWQIIYFSTKEEIKDVLKSDIDSSAINYTEVQKIFH
jgi:DNA repair exonuclease SbcCD ATPase subunit